jgi:mono/diheme cytochrome c family protein
MNKPIVRVFSGIALLALAVLLASPASHAQDKGAAIYKAKCVSCHGAAGDGNTPVGKATKARDLCSADVKKETDAEMMEMVLKGKNKMPAQKISEDEAKQVIAYIRSLCKGK